MAAYDCIQFPTPLVAKSNIVSEGPIDFALRRHKSDHKVDIAVGAESVLRATAK
jgi:hypothetical protein